MMKISSLASRLMKSLTRHDASVESAELTAKRRNRWIGLDTLEDRKMLAADLSGVIVNFSAGNFTPGQTVYASVFYQNTDAVTAAGPHTVKLYRSQDNNYDVGTDTLLASTVVSSLAPGAAKSIQFSWIATSVDAADDATPTNGNASTFLVAVIDEEDSVTETSDVNNEGATAAADYTVTVPIVSVLGAAPTPVGGSTLTTSEGATGTSVGKFVLSRTGATTLPLTVTFSYAGSTSGAADYAAGFFGTVTATFLANKATTVVTVAPIVDTNAAASETTPENLILTLSADVVGTVDYTVIAAPTATNFATRTMVINDTVPTISIKATDKLVSESSSNTGSYRISRTGNTSQAVDVLVDFNNATVGNAQIGVDFTATVANTALTVSGGDQVHVIIPANRTFVDMKIIPIDDVAREGNETINPVIQPDAGLVRYLVGTASDNVTLKDNDIVNLTALVVAPVQQFTSPTTSKNQTIRFSITIANASAGTAVPTTVSVGIVSSAGYVAGDGEASFNNANFIPLQTFSIGSLRAGGVLRKNFTMRLTAITALPVDSYAAVVKVDAGNAIIEDPSAVPSLTAPEELDNYSVSAPTISVI